MPETGKKYRLEPFAAFFRAYILEYVNLTYSEEAMTKYRSRETVPLRNRAMRANDGVERSAERLVEKEGINSRLGA